ncbi:hypothetical protein BJF92_16655 [Rhizobium rhizosphaerae]|uniref:Uncharacterized protein n=1 Tax=Xaviernesmea rhizosphaerae TaxID=1672749 RepID=A0A1Q9AIK1_9HYPH|nr:hypothetical protein [Xaviernesmea rhizosphaerae]OLP55030.1 hypothetical protein BJF92_16655 [Xaviernesmea rhizosphaerae]OQP85801.1 hypothetical protein BTR14_13530 [Xaviernesmea rhizosphaerae]
MWTIRKNILTTGLVALTIAGTTIATASQAEAHNNFGRGLAAGIAGTLIGGALVASASHPAYAAPVYTTPVYDVPAYPQTVVVAQPACRVVWRQDGYGDMYRTRVCV